MIEHLQINDVVPCVHYGADGVQAAFTFPFAVFKAADLGVWLDKVLVTSGFTVSGIGITAGGAVLFNVPPAAGCRVTLRRRMALERVSDFQTDGIIRAKTLNDELDYQVAAVQQVADDVSRCLQRPFTSASNADLSLPDPVAGRGLKWNADGSGLENGAADLDEVVVIMTAQARAAAQAREAVDMDRAAVAADRQVAVSAAAATTADRSATAADRAAVTALHAQVQQAAEAAEVSALSVGARLVGSSSSALTLATGPVTLMVEPAKGWAAGMTVTLSVADQPTRFMTGRVVFYDAQTGELQVEVEDVQGSGLAARWAVVISGRRGLAGQGSGDLQAVNGLVEIAAQGEAVQQTARASLGLGALATKSTTAAADLVMAAPAIVGRAVAGGGGAAELSLSQVLDLVGGATQGDILYRGASGWGRLPAASGFYLKSNGPSAAPAWAAAPGRVLGFSRCTVTSVASTTATIPFDDTPPLNSEGAQFLAQSYVVQAVGTSSLRIDVSIQLAGSNNGTPLIAALFWGQSGTALGAATQNQTNLVNGVQMLNFTTWINQSAGAGYSHSFSVRAGAAAISAGTVTFNGAGGSRLFGGVIASSLTITEYQ